MSFPSHCYAYHTKSSGLMEIADAGQNNSRQSFRNEMKKGEVAREQKLAECLKELAAFQNNPAVQSTVFSNALYSPGSAQPSIETYPRIVSSKGATTAVTSSQSVSARIRGGDAAGKGQTRGGEKQLSQKPWSFSTKSPGPAFKAGGASIAMAGKAKLDSFKSSTPGSKSRKTMIPSSALVFGRRLSSTPDKRRLSLGRSPVLCKRASFSPAENPRASGQGKKTNQSLRCAQPVVRKKLVERATPPSKVVNKLSDRQKEILRKVAASPGVVVKKKLKRQLTDVQRSSVDLSVAGRRARRLSQVLRNENEIMIQNKECEKEMQRLRHELACKDQEVDRIRSAGMLLKQLCANQSEELKALKGAIPSILKEASDLREQSHKQENAIHMAQRVKVSLEAELASLRERVASLTNDIKQTRAVNTKLAEQVHKTQKMECQACRLNNIQKSSRKEVSPLCAAKRSGMSYGTPPRPRDAKAVKKRSPKQPTHLMEEVYNPKQQQENKELTPAEARKVVQDPKQVPDDELVFQVRCENAFIQEVPSSKGAPSGDALKNKINNLLLSANRALENQHRPL